MWWEVITEALLDTLKLFPFLFLLYILIELMEHNTRIGKPGGALTGKAAPFLGAATGLVPMCGFSVMAAKLYERRYLTVSTLLAVFIATSDEAFFVLLTSPMGWLEKLYAILATCGTKLVLGVAAGYLVDVLFRRKKHMQPLGEACFDKHVHEEGEAHMRTDEYEPENGDECAHEQVHEHEHEHENEHEHVHGEEYTVCEHKHGKESVLSLYFVSPLLHALKIAAFILIFNLAFGYLVFGIGGGNAEAGEERVLGFLQGAGYWYQPLVSCLVALIPNCVSSVVITEAFAFGGIAFGSFLGGLVTNAGLGYLVLFRKRSDWKRGLPVLLFMLAFGIAVGYALNGILLLF